MKKVNQILFAGTIAAVLSVAGQARAQDDGIAASPKVRQMLNERKASQAAAKNNSGSSYRPVASDRIAASPKVEQMLQEKRVSTPAKPSTEGVSVAYKPVGKDGIAASPKVRQQLDERRSTVMVAPVK